jgi:hypothetical protein
LDHAREDLRHPADFKARDYLKEESRVIKGSETQTARKLGEGTRTTPYVNPSQLYKVSHSDMR